MKSVILRSTLAISALGLLFAAESGCATTRDSRNGVFNENQYVRKDFLVRPDGSGNDNGWFMKATIIQASAPNPLANLNFFVGSENGGSWVRWGVTQDTLQMINMRELSPGFPAAGTRTPEVVNSWPATNVDLKYRVNLDGERTNFYEENQELDWQVRQWVKINWGKNGPSDFAAFGGWATGILQACTDTANTTSTLVPDSFKIEDHGGEGDYLTFKVALTVPLKSDDAACVEAFQDSGGSVNHGNPWDTFQKLGRSNVQFTLMYSMVRAKSADEATKDYQPLVIEEKDRIRRKYGTIDFVSINRDQAGSDLLNARALSMRFNPNKPLTWYFAPGYPEEYKHHFTDSNGIVEQTNKLFEAAGKPIRLSVKNFDQDLADGEAPREFGDVRYNFLRWEQDIDTDSPFIGVTQFVPDPRTGELVSASINMADFQFQDRVKARLDFYLESIGAVSPEDTATGEWKNPIDPATGKELSTCQDGDSVPLVPDTVAKSHNAKSSLYRKMQEYLQKPSSKYGNLGPQDFIQQHDSEFESVFFTLLPYQLYADPETNQFVIPEGGAGTRGPTTYLDALRQEAQFHKVAGQIDKGIVPYDPSGADGFKNAMAFMDNFKNLQRNHSRLNYLKNFNHGTAQFDDGSMISQMGAFVRDARHCVNGHWETKAEYMKSMVDSYHALTVWHEFGHSLGLDHNFMASVDKPNFPHYKDKAGRDHVGMYQSSVMEYNAVVDRVFWKSDWQSQGQNDGSGGGYGWGPYDRGAIAFIYANDKRDDKEPGGSVSGQLSATSPWKDPIGFDGKTGKETQYLFCNANHLKYSPFCRQFDFGSTPSEIIANEIDTYEWNYQWRNFRMYRKLWDESAYADAPANEIAEMRRFISAWAYDWQSAEITDTMRRLGIKPPDGGIAAAWYEQLNYKFEMDISAANQMVGAFHKAIIQQSSGERPFVTKYDPYYGDVTQQGIILDKLFALQSWTDLWPVENYDVNQAAGAYMASYSSAFGDATFETITEDAVESMIGGQYDIFPFGRPLAVGLFAKATHDVNYGGRIEVRDWVGGHVFWRERDFLDFFREMATTYNTAGCYEDKLDSCEYDPTLKQVNSDDINHSDDYNEFIGPDHRRYIWAYVPDRNAWVVADKDRNTATYVILRNFTADVVHGEADGSGYDGLDPYGTLLPIKYFLDAYNQYN